jgi:hypothetical protein
MISRRWFNLMFPYWMLVALALSAPVRDLYVAVRAQRRVSHGQCGTCGYETNGADECPACAARRRVVGLTPRTHLA